MATISPDKRWRAPFFTIWFGQAASLLGSSLVQFALVWWLTLQTGSATVLAMASLVGYLPTIVLGPFAGAMVDRLNRRRVMIFADAGIAAATALLGVIYLLGWMQTWHIYVILLMRAIGGTFHWPAMQASTTMLVPKEQLARIGGMNQMLSGLMNIVSPPLGLVVSVLPLYGVLSIDIVTALIAITTLLFVAIPQPKTLDIAPTGNPLRTLLQDVVAGFRYVVHWQGLLILMIMAALINMLINPIGVLLPLLVTRVFHGGALQLGSLESVFGVGVVLGGLGLSVWGGFKRRIMTVILGLIGQGTGVMTMGLAPTSSFWIVLVGIFLIGVMISFTNGPLTAVVQTAVAPEVQGRVFTTMASLSSLMTPLGLALSGPITDAVGLRVWYIFTAVCYFAVSILALIIPAVRNLEHEHAKTNAPAAEVVAEG